MLLMMVETVNGSLEQSKSFYQRKTCVMHSMFITLLLVGTKPNPIAASKVGSLSRNRFGVTKGF